MQSAGQERGGLQPLPPASDTRRAPRVAGAGRKERDGDGAEPDMGPRKQPGPEGRPRHSPRLHGSGSSRGATPTATAIPKYAATKRTSPQRGRATDLGEHEPRQERYEQERGERRCRSNSRVPPSSDSVPAKRWRSDSTDPRCSPNSERSRRAAATAGRGRAGEPRPGAAGVPATAAAPQEGTEPRSRGTPSPAMSGV